jgi:hypothetical protein
METTMPVTPLPVHRSNEVSDTNRTGAIFLRILIAVVLAMLITESIGTLLAIAIWPGMTDNPLWVRRIGVIGNGLQLRTVIVFLPVASVIALGIAGISTRSWSARDQGRAMRMTALVGIPALMLLSRWDGGFPERFAAGGNFYRSLGTENVAGPYHPDGLSVTQEGDVFRVRPVIRGTFTGLYRVEVRVTLDRTGDELWRHARGVELPRLAGLLDDRFTASELDDGYRRVMSVPGAGYGVGPNPLRCTCVYTMTMVHAEPSADGRKQRGDPMGQSQASHCRFTRNVTESSLFATVSAARH